ncbi:MAG: hypothetical protein MHPSP_000735 [Paramarteilia canceri]
MNKSQSVKKLNIIKALRNNNNQSRYLKNNPSLNTSSFQYLNQNKGINNWKVLDRKNINQKQDEKQNETLFERLKTTQNFKEMRKTKDQSFYNKKMIKSSKSKQENESSKYPKLSSIELKAPSSDLKKPPLISTNKSHFKSNAKKVFKPEIDKNESKYQNQTSALQYQSKNILNRKEKAPKLALQKERKTYDASPKVDENLDIVQKAHQLHTDTMKKKTEAEKMIRISNKKDQELAIMREENEKLKVFMGIILLVVACSAAFAFKLHKEKNKSKIKSKEVDYNSADEAEF